MASKSSLTVLITVTVALLIYFGVRGQVIASDGYDNESIVAVFWETLLPLGLILGEAYTLFNISRS